jgi:hypothetical protein
MRGNLNIRMLSVRAALLAVLAAGLVLPCAQAQNAKENQKSDKQPSGSSQAPAPREGGKAGEEESAPANREHAGGPQEGIKVHGHWVIDVRNPDGELVTHREFENALIQGGQTFLETVLLRAGSVGYWQVLLDAVTNNYLLTEPGDATQGNGNTLVFNTLAIGGSGVTLFGTFTAASSDTVGSVYSIANKCVNSPPQSPCGGGGNSPFTFTTLSPGVSFVSGQIVQVTVKITFS